jgi:signal peptidase I
MSITKESPSQLSAQAVAASTQSASLVLSGGSSSELGGDDLRRIRQSVAAILLTLLLFIVARLWCLEGLLFPVAIEGASMADTLVGEHYRVKCVDCGHVFRCDATNAPSSMLAACPNCGYTENKLQVADYRPGEQVLVDRWVYLLGRPRRWDIVAITDPDNPQQRVVKRIVGLPGETIGIRRGDIIVNGQPVAKDLKQLQEQATLVYDSKLPPKMSKGMPARWQAASGDESYWREREHSYFYRAHIDKDKPRQPQVGFDWLSFRYVDRSTPHTEYSPVRDFDAYNQNRNPNVNLNLNDVADLLLTCRATVAKYGCLVFAAVDGADRFEVHLCHDEHKLKVLQNGELLTEELLPHRDHDEPIDIQFALCDGRVLFGMDGRQVLAQPYQREKATDKQTDPQLQIGGAGSRIRISNARVYRDLYYLDQDNTNADWAADKRIPPNHYFLLGDSPVVSNDSRHWPQQAAPRSAIQGRVIQPWWAVQ